MAKTTTKAIQWLPSAANGTSITPSGSAWSNTGWTQFLASSSNTLQLISITYTPGIAADFEIEFGVGGAGSEVGIGSLHARALSTIATGGDYGLYLGAIIDKVPNASRLSMRLRTDSTDVTAWKFAIGYMLADDSTDLSDQVAIVTPGAQNLSATVSSGGTWTSGAYLETTSGIATAQLLTSLSISSGGTTEEYEIDIGVGGAGSEVVATTLRANVRGNNGTGHYVLPNPLYLAANTRIATRVRAASGTYNTFIALNTTPCMYLNISVSDASTVTESTTVSWPLAETFQENFDFGGIDSGKWASSGSTITIGTNLDAEFTTNNNYIDISSLGLYNLTGSYMYSQVTDAGDQTKLSFEVYPVYLIADANNKIFIRITGNTVQPIKVVANVTTNIGTGVTYNSTTMKYFRIRESGGTTFFDYAADPTSTWTNITSATNPITVTALTLEILVGTWNLENSTAKLDNVNTYPAQYQFSWKGYTWNQRIHQGAPTNNQWWTPTNVSGPDGNGYLTFTLSNPSATPYGGEMFSDTRGWGYGTYVAVIGTQLNTMDHRVGWGNLFTFDFTAAPDYREIDAAEIRDYASQANIQLLHSHAWNNAGARNFTTNNQDVNSASVQTHVITWEPGKITFDAYSGTGTGGTNLFHTVQTDNIPTPGLERVHFNIWNNTGVTNYQYVSPFSVIVRDFSFGTLLQINVSDSSAVTESTTATISSSTTVSINVFDGSTVTESLTMLERDNINVFDSSIVTENVSVIEIDNISISDSSTVTENTTMCLIDNITVNDSSTVLDVIVQDLESDNAVVADATTVTEQVTMLLTDFISVSDSSVVTENISVVEVDNLNVSDASIVTDVLIQILEIDNINVSDSSTVTDVPTLILTIPPIVVSDSSTVTESLTMNLIDLISIFDSSTVTENITLNIPVIMSVFDSSIVTDFVTMLLIDNINTSDSSTVTNVVIQVLEIDTINVNDSSTVTDIITQILETDNINVNDSSTVLDVIVQDLESDNVVVADVTTVTESTTVILTIPPISVFDSSAVTENLTMLEIDFISMNDSSAITDSLIQILEIDFISVNDNSTITDSLVQILEIDTISVFDSSAVTESTTVTITTPTGVTLSISVFDASTVTESTTMLVTYFVSVFDASAVTEAITMETIYCINVFDGGNLAIGVVAYYSFDENSGSTVSDSSGKGNNGTWQVASSWAPGIINSGGNFTGANYVSCGNPSNLGLSGNSPFTISAWVNPSASNGGSGSNAIFDYGAAVGSERISLIYIVDYSLRSSHFSNDHTFTTKLDQNTQNHIVLTYDGTTESLYKNGVFKESWNPTPLSLVSGGALLLGNSVDGHITGATVNDEIALWNRGVSADEVAFLYNNRKGAQFNGSAFPVGESISIEQIYNINVSDTSIVTEATTMLMTDFVTVFDASTVTENSTVAEVLLIYAAEGFPAGLIAYYKYDENTGTLVADSVGGHDGTWHGTLGSQWGTGIINSGGNFNGTDNYVESTIASGLSNSFTISTWIKMGSIVPQSQTIAMSFVSSYSNYWFDLIAPGGVGNPFRANLYDGTNNPFIDSGTSPVAGAWYHVVMVRDTSTGKLLIYVNGNADGNTTDTTTSVPTYSKFEMGLDVGRSGIDKFNGIIDEVALFNKALTTTEIANLYNRGMAEQYNGQYLQVTDSATATIVETNIIFDSSTVTDVITQILETDNINIFDSSTVTDVPTVVIPTYSISVTDTSTITDVVTQVLEIDTISVFDSSTVTESVTLLTTDSINVFEASTVTENSTPEIIDFVSIFDASAVTESLTVVIPTVNNTISVFDSSTVTDVSVVELVNLISIIDTTTVTDVLSGQNGGIYLNPLDLSVFEVIGPYQFIFVDGRLAMRLFQNFYIFV